MSDDRFRVAAHEAGHVEVARALGATGLRARVFDTGTDEAGGHFTGHFEGSRADEAIIMLAGAAGARLIAGGPEPAHETDLRTAKRLLRGSGVSVSEAERRAARLVQENRGAIERTARRLLRRGRA